MIHHMENSPKSTGKRISPAPLRAGMVIRLSDRPVSIYMENRSKDDVMAAISGMVVKSEITGPLTRLSNRMSETEIAVPTAW